MIPPGGDCHGVGEAADGYGRRPPDGGAVAELCVDVVAPAADGTIGEERACVSRSSGEGHGIAQADDGHRRQLTENSLHISNSFPVN